MQLRIQLRSKSFDACHPTYIERFYTPLCPEVVFLDFLLSKLANFSGDDLFGSCYDQTIRTTKMGFVVCHIEAQPSYFHPVTNAEFVLCGAPNDMYVYIAIIWPICIYYHLLGLMKRRNCMYIYNSPLIFICVTKNGW